MGILCSVGMCFRLIEGHWQPMKLGLGFMIVFTDQNQNSLTGYNSMGTDSVTTHSAATRTLRMTGL